eukprot:5091109-Pyramimonas_sp.AAC.1
MKNSEPPGILNCNTQFNPIQDYCRHHLFLCKTRPIPNGLRDDLPERATPHRSLCEDLADRCSLCHAHRRVASQHRGRPHCLPSQRDACVGHRTAILLGV